MSAQIAHDINTVPRTEDVCLFENVYFKDMFFSESLHKSLTDNGFHKPSPIQYKALPLAGCGFDLIVKSKSGTGKTLIFVVTTLENLDLSITRVQAIVIAPTREIALQSADVFRALGSEMKGLTVGTFIGGMPLKNDIETIKKCHIAVGAPGRIRQLIELGHLKTEAVRLFILDEADQLISETFQNDINFIYWSLSEFKQMLALSATYPAELVEFLSKYMRSGKLVTPKSDPIPVLIGLKQFVSLTRSHPDFLARLKDKEERLMNLLKMVKFNQCLIFSNYQSRAESMCNMLRGQGWSCEWMSGKQPQEQRIHALSELKSNRCRLLVTTDLTSRGIDSKGIDLVINMDIPRETSVYLHRMGRAGRYGSHGVVITILSHGQELENFLRMLGRIDMNLPVSIIPSGEDFDLWSPAVNDFDKLYGLESPQDDENKPKHVLSEFTCPKTSKNKKSKTDKKSDKTIKNQENDANQNNVLDPPIMNKENFPSIEVRKPTISLNDYFSIENNPGDFLSLNSLQDSLKSFAENKMESIDLNGDITKNINGTNSDFKSVIDIKLHKNNLKKTKQINQSDKSKNQESGRRFSYSDIAKGKRAECKPVKLTPDELAKSSLVKSPLKLFPAEKVLTNIEGISISDRAIDGFSKRMYSSVVKGKRNESKSNSNTDNRVVKTALKFDSVKNSDQIVDKKSQIIIGNSSSLQNGNSINNELVNLNLPLTSSNLKPEFFNKNDESEKDQFERQQKINSLTTTVKSNQTIPQNKPEKNKSIQTKFVEVTNKSEPDEAKMSKKVSIKLNKNDNKLNSNDRIIQANAISSPKQISSNINDSIDNSFYERQTADLSQISFDDKSFRNRSLGVRFEDSTTDESSISEGEYIIAGSFPKNSSFNKISRSGSMRNDNNYTRPFSYNDWIQMYNDQLSLIYTYVKHANNYSK